MRDLSKYESSMVFYMGLKSMPDLVERMKPYYPPSYPVSVVYFAGYSDKERVLESRLDRIVEDLKRMEESWLGLVFMGKCLQ
jgi:precorrin-4 methylase